MNNQEKFDNCVKNKKFASAAILAASFAKAKASRAGRWAWLNEVKKLRPDLEKSINLAGQYREFVQLEALLAPAFQEEVGWKKGAIEMKTLAAQFAESTVPAEKAALAVTLAKQAQSVSRRIGWINEVRKYAPSLDALATRALMHSEWEPLEEAVVLLNEIDMHDSAWDVRLYK